MNSHFKSALFSQDSRFYNEIKAGSLAEKETRLNVYRNNVFVSLIEALSDIFPVTHSVVGDDFFRAMARAYIVEHPPSSPILREYGQHFSDFIRGFEAANSLPFLADLAALERNLLTLTHEREHDTLTREDVATVFAKVEDPSTLYLSLPPNTQLLASPFAIGSLYQAHQSDGKLRLDEVDIYGSEYLLLCKSFLYAQLHVIRFSEACFLKNLLQHKSLEDAIPDEADFDLGSMLAKLMKWQLISRISNQPPAIHQQEK
ncbi:DNA-binding domain-containing protein [Marinomonas spartinae]|uniref:HvfC/BufC N-terminal domain-containing protein n=1 Tax=Marinomonas spartinae TaxID=1792290 RepID=UPI0018F23123|nr:DNA-binding domain-containing protein [Marinomonas spartinae]MBJ7553754.1 putative DNA-binding domain-containing protein [Marinomonas spartinae]